MTSKQVTASIATIVALSLVSECATAQDCGPLVQCRDYCSTANLEQTACDSAGAYEAHIKAAAEICRACLAHAEQVASIATARKTPSPVSVALICLLAVFAAAWGSAVLWKMLLRDEAKTALAMLAIGKTIESTFVDFYNKENREWKSNPKNALQKAAHSLDECQKDLQDQFNAMTMPQTLERFGNAIILVSVVFVLTIIFAYLTLE